MRVPFCEVAVVLGARCCRTEIMWAVRFRANETKFQGSYPALTFTQLTSTERWSHRPLTLKSVQSNSILDLLPLSAHVAPQIAMH